MSLYFGFGKNCQTANVSKMASVMCDKRSGIKDGSSRDPTVGCINVMTVAHHLASYLSQHLAQSAVRVNYRVRLQEGREFIPSLRSPVAQVGPGVKLRDGHEREDPEFSIEMRSVSITASVPLEEVRQNIGIDYN